MLTGRIDSRQGMPPCAANPNYRTTPMLEVYRFSNFLSPLALSRRLDALFLLELSPKKYVDQFDGSRKRLNSIASSEPSPRRSWYAMVTLAGFRPTAVCR